MTQASLNLSAAEHIPMPAADYHADAANGSSDLELFRQSRREYHAVKVAKTKPPKAATEPMQLGTMIHCKLFEPEKFHEVVADPLPKLAPDGKKWLRRQGSDHEKWWQEELNKREGRIACDADTLETVDNVVAAIRANPWAARILGEPGETEYSVFWTDSETGLRLKCRFDWFSATVLDLKTTASADPRDYSRQVFRLGYHRKWAHYKAGLNALRGEQSPFVHIAAETSGFYRVGCFEIDDRDKHGFALGVAQRRRTLHDLAECYETGDWREPWEKMVVVLELPASAFYEDQYVC